MAPYDINREAREVARDSNFEQMMWYAWYVISENMPADQRDDIKSGIEDLVNAARVYHFADQRIYEMKLTSFVLIMDDIHYKLARDRDTFESYTQLLTDCMQALVDNDLIDANPMAQLRVDPGYYSKYWP